VAIVTRLVRLVRADVNAVLDRIEEPGILLQQAVRDMEEVLQQDGQQAAALDAERLRLLNRRSDEQDAVADLAGKLTLCLDAGKEDLARDLMRRRLESERLARLLGEQIARLDSDLVVLNARLATNRSKYESVRAEAAVMARDLDDDPAPAPAPAPAPGLGARFGVSDTDVEVALLYEKQRRAL